MDIENRAADCGSPLGGECNAEIQTEEAKATISLARRIGKKGLRELPLSKQQKRVANRKRLTNPWMIIKWPQPGPKREQP